MLKVGSNKLVVVHANMLEDQYEEESALAVEIRNFGMEKIKNGRHVFLLPMAGTIPYDNHGTLKNLVFQSTTIPITDCLNVRPIPRGLTVHDIQYVQLKIQLHIDKISNVDIVGVTRKLCVEAVYRALNGPFAYDNLPLLAQFLQIDQDELEIMLGNETKTRVVEDLCL